MARTRYLKPGFFTNEQLADHSPWHRLLFAGLWLFADRSGRLEDRPKRIKGAVFPYDESVTASQVDQMLTDLAAGDDPFIARYEVDGVRCIQILKWSKHQSPHKNEADSILPSPRPHKKTEQTSELDPNVEASTTMVRPDSIPNGEWGMGNGEWGTGGGERRPSLRSTPAAAPTDLPVASREHTPPAQRGAMTPSALVDGRWARTHGQHAFVGACQVGACILRQLDDEFTAALSVSEGRGPDGRTLRQFYADEVAAIETAGRPVGNTWTHWRAAFERWIGPVQKPAVASRGNRTMEARDRLLEHVRAGGEIRAFSSSPGVTQAPAPDIAPLVPVGRPS